MLDYHIDLWTGVEDQLVPSYDVGSTHYNHYYVERDEFMFRFHVSSYTVGKPIEVFKSIDIELV